MFLFNDDIIKYIIETYTNESGVRKLKELLFEIISEINLEILKHNKKFKIPRLISLIISKSNSFNFLTPDSFVYVSIMYLIISSLNKNISCKPIFSYNSGKI
jgi:ATP-dependent Lon protease